MLIDASIGTVQNQGFSVCDFDDVPNYKKAVQGGYQKKAPNPKAFKMLPLELLEEISETTRVGSARFELMILSHLAYSYAQTDPGEVQYEQGFTVSINQDQFIQTMQTTAEDGYARWYGCESRSEIEKPDGTRTTAFDSFYKRVVRGYKRLLKDGWIDMVGYVNEKFKGIYGTIWELESKLKLCAGRLPDCPPPPPVLIHADIAQEGPYVNAVDMIGKYFLSETSASFTQAECCTALNDRGRFHDHDNWCEVMAEIQPEAARHMSVGAFKPESTAFISEETPCTVPWMILEAESGDIFDRYEATCRILETMGTEGVDLSKVVVTFSGNKSFHIRIPQGMFGNPVYSSVDKCRRTLSRFAYDAFDEHLDVNLFDPRHLIRCTGTKHEKGGFTTAIQGDAFLAIQLERFLQLASERSPWNPHKEIKPRYVKPNAWLMTELLEASESLDRFWIMDYDDAPTISESGAFKAAMQGCEEGEQWHEKHSGRNKLVFVAACALLNKYDEFAAYDELLKVNDRNSPPLPEKEVKSCFVSAKRTISRSNRTR